MAKKNDKDKLIEIAARVLSIEPTMLKDALANSLETSIHKRNLELVTEMLNRERIEHEKEIKELKETITRYDAYVRRRNA